MHITLISMDNEVWASGMRSISSTLRKAGHQTTMIFAGTSEASIDESIIQRIALLAEQSKIIGISSMSRGSSRAKKLINGLRGLGKLLVWGGMHPTIYPEDCIAHADLICRGEGEEFMLDLTERVASGREFKDIRNGAYILNGRVVLNNLRPLITDLDTLPLPDFPFQDEYRLDQSGTFIPNVNMRDEKRILFSGSRGCENNCTYCSNSQLKSIYKGSGSVRFARKMSLPAFVKAAREYCRLFPKAREFYFTDEDFFARPVEEMKELAEIYPRKVGLPFEVMASPRNITEEKMALAVQAGMWRIDIGLESGSERTRREVFKRLVSDEMQMQAAYVIHRYEQVIPYYFLILGNPYEKQEDLINSICLLQKMPPRFFLRAYNLVFIPGTKLFNKACEDKIIQSISDSAYEMDFLAGFNYGEHEWKRKNLYLNGLLSLMVGKATNLKMGYLPRILIPVLTIKQLVDFCDRYPRIGELIVAQANLGLNMRRRALQLVGKFFSNPQILYGIKSYMKRNNDRKIPESGGMALTNGIKDKFKDLQMNKL